MAERNLGLDPQGGASVAVPVVVDDVKRYPDFLMTRCTYFSVECDEPTSDWTLGLGDGRIPLLMMGLSGIVLSPPGDGRLFERPDDFGDLFEFVEQHESLYVDVSDIWIPNECFTRGEPRRGEILRLGQPLFAEALAFRESRSSAESYRAAALALRGEIVPSAAEGEALRAWNLAQIDDAKRRYQEEEERALAWADDERFPERSRERGD